MKNTNPTTAQKIDKALKFMIKNHSKREEEINQISAQYLSVMNSNKKG